jgi:hypothetical protein
MMPDYRTLFDEKWVKAWDLGGKERTVTIEKVVAGILEDPRKKTKDRKPIVWFKGAKKPLALNKTNSKTIANMYGNMTEGWIGKSVTLYPTTTQVGPDSGVDCIRIKPGVPKGKAEPMPEPPPVSPADEPVAT